MVSVVALQGCQVLDVFDGEGSAEAEPSIEVTKLPVDPAYPKLRTVPPRPQLSYSVEQHREIVESLIGDREHARYTSQRLRYRAGLSSLPPPPAPEPDEAATATADAIVGDGQQTAAPAPAPRADVPTAGYGDFADPGADDDASLGDFMRNMIEETDPTSPAGVEPAPGDDPPQPEPEGSSGVDPSPGMSAAPPSHSSAAPASGDRSATRLFAWIGDAGQNAAPVEPAAGTAPAAAPGGGSSKGDRTSPADAVPVQAVAAPRHNGAAVEAAHEVEVAAASEPVATVPGTNGNAQASRDGAGDPSPPTPPAAPPAKPEPGSAVQPASEPDATDGPPRSGTATITFADGSAELPADATSRLEAALASLEGGGVIEVVGRGEPMTLALDRAHAVAVGLMRLGAGAGDLEIAGEAAPGANDVRIRVGGRR